MNRLDDAVFVLGCCLIGYGAYMIYPPLCWIVSGAMLAVLAYAIHLSRRA